ncbi:MAG: hypothetical protein ACI8PB_005458 [Desulforhopalus sp.]|jgi:hypothetical protein
MNSKRVSSKELTKDDAMQWAIRQMNEDDKLLDINSIYEIEPED